MDARPARAEAPVDSPAMLDSQRATLTRSSMAVVVTRSARSCSRWAQISRSPSPRAWPRSSPAPARCWPKPCTRWPTAATSCCCCSACARPSTPPSPDYPLGYGKAIYFWSFLVAVMLFSVGGMFSLYEGIHKLQHPEPLKQWWWAVGVLVVQHHRRSLCRCAPACRGQQGARRAHAVALVPREPPGRAGRHLRRRPCRAARPGAGAGRRHAGRRHRQPGLGCDRHARDRRAADRRGGVRRDRGQGDADRSKCRPGSVQRQISEFFEGRPEIARVISLITLQLGNEVMVVGAGA